MNEFEKAKAYITNRNNSLTETSRRTDIALPTLKSYRAEPDKLRTAAWERVHELAKLYDTQENVL